MGKVTRSITAVPAWLGLPSNPVRWTSPATATTIAPALTNCPVAYSPVPRTAWASQMSAG